MTRNLARVCVALACAVMFAAGVLGCAYADTTADAQEGTSIVSDEAGFGLSGFTRLQVGTNKSFDGDYLGYAYALGEDASQDVTVVDLNGTAVVYVPQDVADAAGFDTGNAKQANLFKTMLEELDAGFSNGGPSLTKTKHDYVFTSKQSYKDGDVTIAFNTEVESGYYYAIVTKKGLDNNKGVASFCDTFQLLEASQVQVAQQEGVLGSLMALLGKIDYRPLWVSLKTAAVAMVFIFVFGLLAAWRSMHVKSRWKSVLDSVFTIPMVLPPTVCGFLLLLLFGKSTHVGQWFIAHGIDLVFTWPAAVIAAAVVGFPLMYRTVLGAFEALDVNMLDAARTLGWSEGRIFYKLMLPLAWPSIAAGLVLAFARAMGEFGATLFFAGNYAGVTQTMPIAIYFSWMGGSTDVAIFWVIVVIVISFVIIMFINLYSAHVQKFRQAGASGIDEDMGFAADAALPADEAQRGGR